MNAKVLRRINMRRFSFVFMVALVAIVCGNLTNASAQTRQEIRLVLQITIDGLRADLINRYENGFGEGGFRLLMEKGTYFTNAHYQHANTETIVGHTTLATGTFPPQHGVIGNVWFDREAKELAYNIEDADAPLLPTLSDGLAAYYGGRPTVFGVSGKDRSAVAMAGQVGKAFWFSTDNVIWGQIELPPFSRTVS